MVRFLLFSITFLVMNFAAFAQEVKGNHEIIKNGNLNDYIVKTTVSGLSDVDIARVTYQINNLHTYNKLSSNELFSSRNKDYIKFFIMGIPDSGKVMITLGLKLADNKPYSFPVELQYSKNEEKQVLHLPSLVFASEELLAVEDQKINKVTIETDTTELLGENSSDMETATLAASNKTGSVSTVKKEEDKTTIKEELADTKVVYTIQLLSLSKFSQARFDEYCDKHSLLPEEVSTRVVNGMTKVIYGKAKSLAEAKKLIDRLKLLNNIDGAFAVPL
ncbi:MAG: SPOR domain-containing protein [Vicingaceae bacterium]